MAASQQQQASSTLAPSTSSWVPQQLAASPAAAAAAGAVIATGLALAASRSLGLNRSSPAQRTAKLQAALADVQSQAMELQAADKAGGVLSEEGRQQLVDALQVCTPANKLGLSGGAYAQAAESSCTNVLWNWSTMCGSGCRNQLSVIATCQVA